MTNLSKQNTLDSLARKAAQDHLINFAVVTDSGYDVSWHHRVIADELQRAYERVLEGKRTRLILELPPRHGKSELATIKFPAWVLGRSPNLPVIVVSYAADLAADFGLATKDLMNTDNYKKLFDTRLREDAKARAKWLTKKGGSYDAVGVGGPITGKGFSLGIIDDPIKSRGEADSLVVRESLWKWYRSTFLTREDSNAAIIVIMTRWHDDDLCGRILSSEGAGEWKVIKFPAIAVNDEVYRNKGEALWPKHYSLDVLETRRKDLGPYEWSALYQQSPVNEESREFKETWIHYRTLEELQKKKIRTFVTIDTASRLKDESDFVGVCLNMVDSENKWNFITWQLKVGPHELIDFIFKLNTEYNVEKFGIEEGAYNDVFKPFLEDEMRKRSEFLTVVELKHNQQNKLFRIRGLIPRYSSVSVFHIEGMCDVLEEEMMHFPKGIHDDVLDAAAYQSQLAEAPLLIKRQPQQARSTNWLNTYWDLENQGRYRASPRIERDWFVL